MTRNELEEINLCENIDENLQSNGKNVLQISGKSSTVLPPDIIEMICILRSTKATVEEVRNSIDRRKEYIITHAKKARITEKNHIKVHLSKVKKTTRNIKQNKNA